MGKRQKDDYIAQQIGRARAKNYKDMLEQTVPAIYAAVGIALFEKGWRFKRINDVFARSQEIWAEHVNETGTMCQQFSEMTGIDVMNGVSTSEGFKEAE